MRLPTVAALPASAGADAAGRSLHHKGSGTMWRMQSYANHSQIVPLYHRVLALIILLTLIGACVNLYESWGDHQRLYSASLIVALCFIAVLLFWFVRIFPLRAQDRAI